MLLQRVVLTINLEQIPGQVPTDRKQHRDPAANAVRRIGVTLLVEINDFAPLAAPLAHDAAAFRE
jgi:hypothetical protein